MPTALAATPAPVAPTTAPPPSPVAPAATPAPVAPWYVSYSLIFAVEIGCWFFNFTDLKVLQLLCYLWSNLM